MTGGGQRVFKPGLPEPYRVIRRFPQAGGPFEARAGMVSKINTLNEAVEKTASFFIVGVNSPLTGDASFVIVRLFLSRSDNYNADE
jgi:hypothetical protein